MKTEDIVKASECLIEHLLKKLNDQVKKGKDQWYELGIDQGNQLGTRTLVSGDTKEQIMQEVLTSKQIQDRLLQTGFDHVFIDIWQMDTRDMPNTICTAAVDCVTLFNQLSESIPIQNYESYGSIGYNPDGTFKIEKEWINEGAIYKNELAYVFFKNFPAYAGDLYEPEEYDTRQNFVDCVEDEIHREETALKIFHSVSWENPLTIYLEIYKDNAAETD